MCKCTWRSKVDIESSWMAHHFFHWDRVSLLSTELTITVVSLLQGSPGSAFGVLELQASFHIHPTLCTPRAMHTQHHTHPASHTSSIMHSQCHAHPAPCTPRITCTAPITHILYHAHLASHQQLWVWECLLCERQLLYNFLAPSLFLVVSDINIALWAFVRLLILRVNMGLGI